MTHRVRLLLGGGVAVVLAACAAVPTANQQTILRVVMADDWASTAVVGEVVADFEAAHDGVRVQIESSPFSQIQDLVVTASDIGEPYDVAHWHAFAAAAADMAEPLDDLWERHGLRAAEYLPGAYEDVVWARRRYGIPLDTSALVLLANQEAMRDAGVRARDLATLDGFREAVTRLTDADRGQYAVTVSASSWAAYGWVRAHGGDLVDIDDDGHPTFTFDDPRAIAAVDLLGQMVADGAAPSPFAPDQALDAVQAFAQGMTVLHPSGSWDLPVTAGSTTTRLREIQVLPLPSGGKDAGTVLGGSSLFVPRGAAHRELAFAFMLAMTEDDVALRLAQEEGRLPARHRVFEDPWFREDPGIAAVVDQLPRASVMRVIAYPEISNVFRETLERVLTGAQDAQSAMLAAQRYAEQWVEESTP